MEGQMLSTLLDNEMKEKRLSSRDVARMTGLSHTTILRFLKGDQPDLKSAMAICNALGIDPNMALGLGNDDLAATIAAIIEKHPALGKMFQSLIENFKSGKLSEEEVTEVLSYAAYRLSKKE
jgi:transcriptional regulator with XRE-family HTH domain